MNTAYSEYLVRKPGGGDMALAWLLAHEWGHAMQHLLGLRYSRTLYQELAADCFAGHVVEVHEQHRPPRHDRPGRRCRGHVRHQRAVLQVGRSRRTHGTYQERSDWNRYGYNYGVQACINAAK